MSALAVASPLFLVVPACGGSSDSSGPTTPDAAGFDDGGSSDADSGGCTSDVAPSPGVVVTDRGAVRGALESGAWAYRNIPFAAPPLGALRWKPPAPAACWKGVRDAVAWGPSCPQSDLAGTAPVTGNEDCLQVNVFAPSNTPGPLPVMLWIHGGGNMTGSAALLSNGVQLYDGGALAAKEGVLVVSTNYRLGALGFLAHPLLAAEDPDRSEGNYGIQDLVAALRWVKANAAAFGGDPARVTIFGQSAGALNVCSLVVSPLAKGLFSGAIMESGGCAAGERADAEALGAKVFSAAKCDTAADPLACMRSLTANDVVSALPIKIEPAGALTGYGPTNDGHVVSGKPLDTIKAGAHAKVPMIVGSNSEETSRSVPLSPIATEFQYKAAVRDLFPGAIGDAVLAQYPAASYASPWAAYVALTTDAKFGCAARKTLRALHASSTPAYRYFLSHPLDNLPLLAKFGAWHGVDILFVFDKLNFTGYTPSANDRAVSDAMMHRWASFARSSSDPNGGQTPTWPAYDAASDPYLELASPLSTGTGVRTAACDFWAAQLP